VGVNGQLPNLDLINTITTISRNRHIPVVLENNGQHSTAHAWLGGYGASLSALVDMISKQALGRASNLHGYYRPYKIDAVTISANEAIDQGRLDLRKIGV
jgi:glycosylphosphatidylinositol transamidase